SAPPPLSPLPLHDALPISCLQQARASARAARLVIRGCLYQTQRLTQTRLLQETVGLYHVAEPFFRTPVTAIRIRMVALHKCLIARLDVGASRLCVKTKRFQRLGLKRLHPPLPRLDRLPSGAEEIERITDAAVITGMAGTPRRKVGSGLRARIAADGPGRPVAGERLLLETRDLAVREPGKVVITL